MTNSAAGSSDLQKNIFSSSTKVTFTYDAMKDHYDGSSSGSKPSDMGMQTVTSREDNEDETTKLWEYVSWMQDPATCGPLTDDIKDRPLFATEAQREARIKDAHKKHYQRKKMKLEHYNEMSSDVEDLRKDNENLRKHKEWAEKLMEKDAKLIEILQDVKSLSLKLLEVYKEKDELKKENEYMKTLMTQQQLAGMSQAISQQQHVGMSQAISQQQHVGIIQQQRTVNMNQLTQQHLVDFDCDNYINRLLNPPGPPQPPLG